MGRWTSQKDTVLLRFVHKVEPGHHPSFVYDRHKQREELWERENPDYKQEAEAKIVGLLKGCVHLGLEIWLFALCLPVEASWNEQ